MKGVEPFNAGKFWHAEEERPSSQGLIQLAAAYRHAATKRGFLGVFNNLDKACEKLEAFQPEYSGVAVIPLLRAIEDGKKEAERVGEGNLQNFNCLLIPKIQFAERREPRSQDEIPGG